MTVPRRSESVDRPAFVPGRTLRRLYPESGVGGYSRYDGFVEFFTRVNALLDSDSRVLDFGAGRGLWAVEPLPELSFRLRSFHERVAQVVGVDVDPVVLDNPSLSDAKVISPGDAIPYPDAAFDVVVSDHVLEHVRAEDAPGVADELMRVLRPGGWLAARTPNKWGIIGVGARAVPNDLHARVLERLQPGRKVEDIFPVQYHMNTRKDLRRLFAGHDVVVYGHNSEPTYFGESVVAWRAVSGLQRLAPPRLAQTLMVFVQKSS